MIVGLGLRTPLMAFNAGKTNNWHVTVAETGLPGNPNRNFFLFSNGIEKNLVGFLQR